MQSPWLHGHQHINPYHLTQAPSIPTLQHAPQPGYYYPYPPQTLHGAVDPGRQHEADVLIDRRRRAFLREAVLLSEEKASDER
eukprot:scaffold3092_cov121-Isochrysis_galbana.AAC.5